MATGEHATERLSEFVVDTTYGSLPASVCDISVRLLIDSVGCALAARWVDKGKLAIEAAQRFGLSDEATIIGGPASSVIGAAFANGELINGLDMDAILVPGHITPFVLPAVLAISEREHRSGHDLVLSNALAHELGARVAASYAPLRRLEEVDGQLVYGLSPATGYGSCIIGAAAGVSKLLGFDTETVASCLGVAGFMTPVPGLGKILRGHRSPHVKYTSAGWVAAGAVTAAVMAGLGYEGDRAVLDGPYGLWRMFSSPGCDWHTMVDGLGKRWRVMETEFKPYPSFRMGHPAIEAFAQLLTEQQLTLEEIDEVQLKADPVSMSELYLNTEIRNHTDAQLSWAFVLAAVALYTPGRDWQMDALTDGRIRSFMPKVKIAPQEAWAGGLAQDAAGDASVIATPFSIPVEVTICARGREYIAAPLPFPKGHPQRPLSLDELRAKFVHNAAPVLGDSEADAVFESLLAVEATDDVAPVIRSWRR